jgi:hypothetical protein
MHTHKHAQKHSHNLWRLRTRVILEEREPPSSCANSNLVLAVAIEIAEAQRPVQHAPCEVRRHETSKLPSPPMHHVCWHRKTRLVEEFVDQSSPTLSGRHATAAALLQLYDDSSMTTCLVALPQKLHKIRAAQTQTDA